MEQLATPASAAGPEVGDLEARLRLIEETVQEIKDLLLERRRVKDWYSFKTPRVRWNVEMLPQRSYKTASNSGWNG